jgi:hypothetical protein
VASSVSAGIGDIDAEQPITEMKSLEKSIHDRGIGLRYMEIFMSIFGELVLVLGVYGVMAYMVTEQNHDIALGMAAVA